ncbi:MAG TPA: EAL domain-containing protein [Acidimicrobiales bacterium]|nr:EAL domain-containing protein [Acidimicrobiales bacterium]
MVIAESIRLANAFAPVAAAVLVGLAAIAASAYGVWANGRVHGRRWRVAWAALGLGLLAAVGAALVQAMDGSSHPPTSPIMLTLALGGGVLGAVGLFSLIRQRLPVRATEALAEAVVAALALGLVIVSLIFSASAGWHPGRDLPLLAVALVYLVDLWLAGSLISLTTQHPVGYRYMIAGFVCLLVAAAAGCVLAVSSKASAVPLDAFELWGACLWAGALLHTSHQVAFDPVPARSPRPSTAHVVVLLVCTMVVPGAVIARLLEGGAAHQLGLAMAAVLLPLVVVLYLLHKVFAHAAAEYRAQHDSLTGICNRTLFEDRVKTTLALAERSGASVAVMYLDLDRFKSINDSLGHAVGNQVLQAVVKRLRGCLRAQDTFARVGGDEFTFLLPEFENKDQCAGFAQRALDTFADPIAVGGRQLTVQASAGIALFPEDGADADTLLKNADTAMYQAKNSGRNTFAVYDAAMSARASLRFALEASLRKVIEGDRLAVHYQPKFLATTGKICGAEALARWEHPRLGFIPPWAFIPLAEETSLVETLGEWVLDTVCHQAKRWHEEGLLEFPVAVNMSARQFARQSAVATISAVLERTRLEPGLLEIEVTESVLVDHMDDVTCTLTELRSMGIRCSIDDFGTGYSALTYLADFPVEAIKIDRSFVSRVDSDVSTGAIVKAVVALAHSLGLLVVAEGVETDAQFRFLKRLRCDHLQGFLFSQAVPADQFAELVRRDAPFGAGVLPATACAFTPIPVMPQDKLDAVLHSIVQIRGRVAEPDVEGIERILSVLQRDELVALREQRSLGSLPARLALGTVAGLTSVTGGLTAAGAISSPSIQHVAVAVFETSTGIGQSPAESSPPVSSATAQPPASNGDEATVTATVTGDQLLALSEGPPSPRETAFTFVPEGLIGIPGHSNKGQGDGPESPGQSIMAEGDSGQGNATGNVGQNSANQGDAAGNTNDDESAASTTGTGQDNPPEGESAGNPGEGNGQSTTGQQGAAQGTTGQQGAAQGNTAQQGVAQGNTAQESSSEEGGANDAGRGDVGQGDYGQGDYGQDNAVQRGSGLADSGEGNTFRGHTGQGGAGAGSSALGNPGRGKPGGASSGQATVAGNAGSAGVGQGNVGRGGQRGRR